MTGIRALVPVWVLGVLGMLVPGSPARAEEKPVSQLTAQVRGLTEGARPYLVRVIRVEADPEHPEADVKRILGSGISLGQGRILTTCSVVGPADTVTVVTADRQQFRAGVAGIDRRTNVALLELPEANLPAIPAGRERILFPGDFVVAVGFGPPMGPQSSFGTVVLASQGHSLQYTEVEMVQVSAPAFPGFSGGVLLNAAGEMVGMLTGRMTLDPDEAVVPPETGMVAGYLERDRIYTTSLSEATLALPAGLAEGICRELAQAGKVERGYLGLQLEMTPQTAGKRSSGTAGIFVHRVVPDGPADRGGLLPGDMILKYAHAPVSSPEELSSLVSATLPGSTVPLMVLRRGTRTLVYVRIEQAPELEWSAAMDSSVSVNLSDAGVAPQVR